MPRLSRLFGTAIGALLLLGPVTASAASLEAAVDLQGAQVEVAPGQHKAAEPMYVTSAPGEPNRLFVVERPGQVLEVDHGELSIYANLASLVSCCESERGLLSIALAPDFPATGRFYAAYTGTTEAGGNTGDLHVDSFVPDGAGGIGGYERVPIITWPHSNQPNHNGGQLQFGPDGDLYISAGDGGGGGDPEENGQNTEALLGKILRIDPEPEAAPAYSSPAGNPFVGGPGRDEIWSYGLRNPWRFSFDSATGDMVIGDVGQNLHEEVDFAKLEGPGEVGGGGRNYGWNCREGFFAYGSPADACDGLLPTDFTEPIWDYPHSGGGFSGCSITGGYVVRDESLGDLYGRYLYSDYCSGGIRSLALPSDGTSRATDDRPEEIETPSGPISEPISYGEDSCHRLYVISKATETVYRFVGDAPQPSCPEPENPPPVEESPRKGGNSPDGSSGGSAARPAVRGPFRTLFWLRGQSAKVTEIDLFLKPCVYALPNSPKAHVVLKQGGHVVRHSTLGRGCHRRFFVPTSPSVATYRAIIRPGPGLARVRTARLRVVPASSPS